MFPNAARPLLGACLCALLVTASANAAPVEPSGNRNAVGANSLQTVKASQLPGVGTVDRFTFDNIEFAGRSGAESKENDPSASTPGIVEAVPLPPAAILFASALAGLGLLTIRRRARRRPGSLPI
jgi:hypothetical protein